MKDLVIVGACGEAFEMIDAMAAVNAREPTWRRVCLLDDDATLWGTDFYEGATVLGGLDRLAQLNPTEFECLVTWSTPSLFLRKQAVVEQLIRSQPALRFATVRHPGAMVSSTARIGVGTYLGAGVVVDARAVVGAHCIAHFGAVISRGVEIGDYGFISSTVNITGHKRIGRSVYLGVKSTINGHVGDHVLVAGGTLVKQDVPAHSIVSNPIGLDVVTVGDAEELQAILGDLPG